VSAIGQTARSRPIKWAPTGKPTAPSGDPVSVSIRLWPRLQRGLFFGGSRLGQCFTVPKAPKTLSPHPLPISAEVSLGFRKCRRPATCHDACPVGGKHHNRSTPTPIPWRARRHL
jgi:hypothetical protein